MHRNDVVVSQMLPPMFSNTQSLFRVGSALWFSLLLTSSCGWATEVLTPPEAQPGIADQVAAARGPANDFHIILRSDSSETDEAHKFLT